MSHYAVLVLVEVDKDMSRDDVKVLVDDALAAFEEQHWDWYQIGGRWTGHFDGYNAEADPKNIETCDICHGTGERPNGLRDYGKEWFEANHGCNGCAGQGTRAKWPTQWAEHAGDVKPVALLNDGDVDVYAICVEGQWFGGTDYLPWKEISEMFPKRERPTLDWLQKEYPEHLAVIVDCHN